MSPRSPIDLTMVNHKVNALEHFVTKCGWGFEETIRLINAAEDDYLEALRLREELRKWADEAHRNAKREWRRERLRRLVGGRR